MIGPEENYQDELSREQGNPPPPSIPTPRLEFAEQLRATLHDGLCQQLAGAALLQAALVNRLEKLAARTTEPPNVANPQPSPEVPWPQLILEARQVGELLRAALDEVRTILSDFD